MTEQTKMNNRVKNRTMDMGLVYKCIDCGDDVSINLGEILYMHDEGLRVVCRCKKCIAEKNKRFEVQYDKQN